MAQPIQRFVGAGPTTCEVFRDFGGLTGAEGSLLRTGQADQRNSATMTPMCNKAASAGMFQGNSWRNALTQLQSGSTKGAGGLNTGGGGFGSESIRSAVKDNKIKYSRCTAKMALAA